MAQDQADGAGLYGTLASWGGGAWNYAASTINRSGASREPSVIKRNLRNEDLPERTLVEI